MKKRKLKISTRHVLRKYKSVDVSLIRLSGKWLENAEFNVGDEIAITVDKKKLVIMVSFGFALSVFVINNT